MIQLKARNRYKCLSMPNTDLSGLDLRNCIFIKCNFDGVDFSNAILGGTLFNDCYMPNCKFKKASMFRTMFKTCTLIGSDFSNSVCNGFYTNTSKFNNAIFNGAKIYGGFFKYCDLSGISKKNVSDYKTLYDTCIFL